MNRFLSIRDYPTIDAVRADYPAATRIVAVDQGWVAFEFEADYQTWRNQR